ncbi:DNA mismatch repair endonuclease MutL [Idiomarina seosinensis]|uniref:DNA mismatch repair protein MutL n=1 Tax=Idiomarina seosinensis TaxID=281739 RepID=A0A432ZDG1_9GAMM|nr:DNA mismatch repair endonuclease MutL [Idiomarina seosinensis]RUO75986.1 DNA mismatch repair protein MutL [Idiomarina seosinensis]
MSIRQLPIELANQIAAGEVVERPASVVKELVENALDAGADQLTIELEQGGVKRIKIRDNGCGIGKDELALALSRHATSKISSLEDLESIASLGFRGEALASISSVSRLRLTSKPAAQAEAWQAWTSGRDMAVQIEPAAHPDGTTIDIQDIFFNTPARRKFLRTEKTEFSHVDETIKRIALSRFDVDITVWHQAKRVRHYPKIRKNDDQQRRRRLAKVCGQNFADNALSITSEGTPFKLDGWIATADECRHQADIQYSFVNGRMMRDKLLSHAIRQAYERYLPPERVPTYVLYFWLPPEQVDVNVHPAKHEVRFHQQRQVHDFILQAIASALHQQQAPAEAQIEQSSEPVSHHHYQKSPTQLNENLSGYRAGPSILPNAVNSHTTQAETELANNWKALAVVESCWLLMRNDSKAAWLDVVAVHQQLLNSQLLQQLSHGLSGQPLLIEVAIDLRTIGVSASQFNHCAELLSRCGLSYRMQANKLVIDTVPSMLRHGNVADKCAQLITHAVEYGNEQKIAAWLAANALPESYSLSQAEYWMRQWLDALQANNEYRHNIALPDKALSK